MALDTAELQCKLDQQQAEIKTLQDAAEKSKQISSSSKRGNI